MVDVNASHINYIYNCNAKPIYSYALIYLLIRAFAQIHALTINNKTKHTHITSISSIELVDDVNVRLTNETKKNNRCTHNAKEHQRN